MPSSVRIASSGTLQRGGGQVLPQMAHRGGAGDQQDVGRAPQQPGERHLHRRRPQALRHPGQLRRLQRREAAEREIRHVGRSRRLPARPASASSARCARLYRFCTQTIVGDLAPVRDLRRRHVAQADLPHQALALQLGQRRQRRLERAFGRARGGPACCAGSPRRARPGPGCAGCRARRWSAPRRRRPGSTTHPRRAGRRSW